MRGSWIPRTVFSVKLPLFEPFFMKFWFFSLFNQYFQVYILNEFLVIVMSNKEILTLIRWQSLYTNKTTINKNLKKKDGWKIKNIYIDLMLKTIVVLVFNWSFGYLNGNETSYRHSWFLSIGPFMTHFKNHEMEEKNCFYSISAKRRKQKYRFLWKNMYQSTSRNWENSSSMLQSPPKYLFSVEIEISAIVLRTIHIWGGSKISNFCLLVGLEKFPKHAYVINEWSIRYQAKQLRVFYMVEKSRIRNKK